MSQSDRWDLISDKMKSLGISEDDLIEKFILGSGKGGQKLQKTSSCVYLQHTVSGIIIKCQKDRLRDNNRILARELLCEKISVIQEKERLERRQEREKERRQSRGRSRSGQKKIREQKTRRSSVKNLRKKPPLD